MVKAHKRKNSGSMRRASRVYLTHANAGKVAALKASLLLYVNVVNYFIERFWSMKDFTAALAEKVVTSRAVNRFKITARLAQCAAKQAKEIVRSQKERKIKTMPLQRRKVATLDNRFVRVEEGVRMIFVSPYKTSQRCHSCGKIDSKNRKGERFRCVDCGHEDDADHNAAKNLEYLGLAGVYSLRLLPS